MNTFRLALRTVAAAAVALAVTAVQARNYTFSQGSWALQATLAGSFSGEDTDNDGYLELAELTAFQWLYTPAVGSALSLDLSTLTFNSATFAFKVAAGSDLELGNDSNEGIGLHTSLLDYLSGTGPLASGQAVLAFGPTLEGPPYNFVDNSSSANIMVTDVTPPVTAIPEPGTALLLAACMGALGLSTRRRRAA